MKLLIVTQVVDAQDPALGFFVSWIEKFSRECESVEVICLRKGTYVLPPNVHVHSLGKEDGVQSRITYAWRFMRLAWQLRRKYDAVFVHMNPEYLVIAGWLWKLLRKRTSLWYMHKSVTKSLRLGMMFADVICTASRESFRLATSKLHIMGHGIDMVPVQKIPGSGAVRVISLGRISASKGIREAISALDVLHARGVEFSYTIVGSAVTAADRAYEQLLTAEIAHKPYASHVHMLGPVHHDNIPSVLAQADVFVHLSDTGSLDKAALEALLAGVPVVTCNDSVKQLVPREWRVDRDDPDMVASAIMATRGADMDALIETVRREHDLNTLVPRIISLVRPTYPTSLARIVMRALLMIRDVLKPFSNAPEVAILCYHGIGDARQADSGTTVTPRALEAQLTMLRASGATFVSLMDVLAWRKGEKQLPPYAVALTFDDGYGDFADSALAILEKFQAPATVFVVGDGTELERRWGQKMLSDDNIAMLAEHELVTIGYHSKSHPDFTMLSGAALEHECQPRFGARLFAYPGGKYTAETPVVLQRLGYMAAFSIKHDLVTRGSDVLMMPRSVVLATTPLWTVRYYTTRAVAWYRRARRSLRA